MTTYQIFIAALRDVANSIHDTSLSEQLAPFLLNTDERLMKEPKSERFKLQEPQYERP